MLEVASTEELDARVVELSRGSTCGRLLLVDDEADIRAIAKMALERIGGWTVTAAGSAAEASPRRPPSARRSSCSM